MRVTTIRRSGIIREDDPELTGARLFVAAQVAQVIRNGLGILGVEAVEEM